MQAWMTVLPTSLVETIHQPCEAIDSLIKMKTFAPLNSILSIIVKGIEFFQVILENIQNKQALLLFH
jgi:hypothetical protein